MPARFVLYNSEDNPVTPTPTSSPVWDIRLAHYQIYPNSAFKVKNALESYISVSFSSTPNINLFGIPGQGQIGGVENSYKVINGYSAPDNKYVTFRSNALEPSDSPPTYGVYPFQGYSLDIWSRNDDSLGGAGRISFYNKVFVDNSSWGALNNTSYYLSESKWSVMYNYTTQTALFATKGGILQIYITEN
jgi:hypothetical protein